MAATRALLGLMVALVVVMGFISNIVDATPPPTGSVCYIAESIPQGLDFQTSMTTAEAWIDLLNNAQSTVRMALFYMDLSSGAGYAEDGGDEGYAIYNAIIAAAQRGVSIQIAMNPPSPGMNDTDALALNASKYAEVRFIPWVQLIGNGILHTKLLISDSSNYYIGSANADWKSMSQVKELGLYMKNNPSSAADLEKVWYQYWIMGESTTMPTTWPESTYTLYNQTELLNTTCNGTDISLYFATAPPEMYVPYRTADVAAIQYGLETAESYFCMEVMDYSPTSYYMTPNIYWDEIDRYIRAAAFRGVQIEMLVSKWNYSDPAMFPYLYSLGALANVTMKLFEVPSIPNQPPFTRVNHAKFFVTDNMLYIGTSNWVADYFINTGGISINIFNNELLRTDVYAKFQRDFNSPYVVELTCPSLF